MNTLYDVNAVQIGRASSESALVGCHFKDAAGDYCRVTGVTADKASGELRVDYHKLKLGHRWSQSLESFRQEMTPAPYMDLFIRGDL